MSDGGYRHRVRAGDGRNPRERRVIKINGEDGKKSEGSRQSCLRTLADASDGPAVPRRGRRPPTFVDRLIFGLILIMAGRCPPTITACAAATSSLREGSRGRTTGSPPSKNSMARPWHCGRGPPSRDRRAAWRRCARGNDGPFPGADRYGGSG